MANILKIKRGLAASIPQGQLAEPLFTTDTYDLYIGKGAGGNQRIQNYIASGTSSQFLKGDGSLDSTTYQATSEKGQNNGYASLDAGGKIPAAQLPSSVIEYKGTWNASTNTPTLADGTGDAGDVYIVSVGGTQNLGSGNITFDAGDWVMYNGSVWQKSTGSNAVASVNGQTGIVVLDTDDISEPVSATNLWFTNARARAAISLTTTGTSGAATYDSGTGVFNIPQYQAVLTNPVTGTGTNNEIAYFNTTGSTIASLSTATYPSLTELSYVKGVTSAIQTQLNAKEPTVTKGNLTEITSSVLTITGGTGAVIGSGTTIAVAQSSGSTSGYLSSTDWTTFNSKQAQLNGTGFVKASGTTISYDNTSYLSLAGGTMTGQIVLKESTNSADYSKGLRFPNDPYGGGGDTSGLRLYADTGVGAEAQVLELYVTNDGAGASQDRINFSAPSNNLVTINGNSIALNSSLSNYLPLTGGTLTGGLIGTTASFTSNSGNFNLGSQTDTAIYAHFGSKSSSGGQAIAMRLAGTLTATANFDNLFGLWVDYTDNAAGYTGVVRYGIYQNDSAKRNYFGGPTTFNSVVTGSDTITGTAFIPTGTSVPSRGMYTSASNVLDFSAGTTNLLSLNYNTGLSTFNTGVRGNYFRIVNVSTAEFGINTENNQGYIGTTTSHGFNIMTNNTPRLTITSGGNVLIGTTDDSAGYRLNITNNGGSGFLGVSNQSGAAGSRYLRMGFGNGATVATIQATRHSVADDVNLALQPGGGNVGIGTASPDNALTVFGTNNSLTSSQGNINVYTSETAGIDVGGSIGLGGYYNGTSLKIPFANITGKKENATSNDANGYLAFLTRSSAGTAERMRITSGGNVGIGNTNPNSYNGAANQLVVGNTTQNNGITIAASTTGYCGIYMADGTTGNEAFRGYIEYGHTADALVFGTSASERMRITSGGNVGIGTASPLSILHILGQSGTTGLPSLLLYGESPANGQRYGFNVSSDQLDISALGTNARIAFFTGGAANSITERMRITNGGVLELATTSSISAYTSTGTAYGIVIQNTSNNTSAKCIRFRGWDASETGSISTYVNLTTYTTTSDYRLKEDFQDFSGLSIIDKIKMYDFKWKKADWRMYGALAHEIKEIIPYAVVGDKDGQDYQSMDYSILVPILTKAIQELKLEVETLKNK